MAAIVSSETSAASEIPSQPPHYPYCMLRTYLCGHPPEIIEVIKHNNRTVHRLLDVLPTYQGLRPLTFSLARCKSCAARLRPKQLPQDMVKSQGHAPIERVFQEGGRDRNGFRDMLWRYRNSDDRDYRVMLMDGYQHHGRIPEELNRSDERIPGTRSGADGEEQFPLRSYQRALRLRENAKLPEQVQETRILREQDDANRNTKRPRAIVDARDAATDQPRRHVSARKGNLDQTLRESVRPTENRRRDLDETYGNRGTWRHGQAEEDQDIEDAHERSESTNHTAHERSHQDRRRVLQGLSDLLAPDFQVKGSNWNLANISHWNDSATGIPDIEEDFEPANDPAIGVDDSLSMVAAPRRAPRQSVDSLQSALSKPDRTSDSIRAPKVFRFSDEVLEQRRHKDIYLNIPSASGRVRRLPSEGTTHESSTLRHGAAKTTHEGEIERQRAEKARMKERMASLGQMGAIPRTISTGPISPPKERKHSKSSSTTGSSFTNEELEKAKKWHLHERLASLGQMEASVRSPKDFRNPKRSGSMRSRRSKSSTDSGSRFNIGRRNTIESGLRWLKRSSKNKGKENHGSIAEDHGSDENGRWT